MKYMPGREKVSSIELQEYFATKEWYQPLYESKGQILRSTPNTAPLTCGACNTQPEGLLTTGYYYPRFYIGLPEGEKKELGEVLSCGICFDGRYYAVSGRCTVDRKNFICYDVVTGT